MMDMEWARVAVREARRLPHQLLGDFAGPWTESDSYVHGLARVVHTCRTASMTDPSELARVGLCASCVLVRRVESDRQSTFYRCEYSKVDPSYPKYPRLPVRACAAYSPAATQTKA